MNARELLDRLADDLSDNELEAAVLSLDVILDPYHTRRLLLWAARRIVYLEERVSKLEGGT